MKSIFKISLLILGVALSSCSYQFDLDKLKSEPKIVLYSYPGFKDTTIIRLSESMPVSRIEQKSSDLSKTKIQMFKNDKSIPVYWTNDSIPGIPAKSFYTLLKFSVGDVIKIRTEGILKDIEAQTQVPEIFPLKSIDLIHKQSINNQIQFQIKFQDNILETNYYAIKIDRKTMYWTDGEYSEINNTIEPDLTDEPLLKNTSGLNDIFLIDNDYIYNLYYWSDHDINGRDYTLRLNTNYMSDYEDHGLNHVICKTQYKVTLYTLSIDLYLYLNSLRNQMGNNMGNAELAPIRPTYTNISNGIGILGGCQVLSSEWINNLKTNEL